MVVVSSWEYFAIMVGGRWFMNMFWWVNTRVKGGGEVDDIFGGVWITPDGHYTTYLYFALWQIWSTYLAAPVAPPMRTGGE